MIQEKRISYETAILTKKCGFNEHCDYLWSVFDEYEFLYCYQNQNKTNPDIFFSAPTQSHLAKWLRDVHGIQVYAVSNTLNENGEYCDYEVHVLCVNKSNGNTIIDIVQTSINDAGEKKYQTYEEAIEAGLLLALKQL
jgi:hypothetical protein